jgi:hypothetical protein
MSWPEDFHPEVGYLPSSDQNSPDHASWVSGYWLGANDWHRRDPQVAFATWENAITAQNGPATMVEKSPPDGRDAISADRVPNEGCGYQRYSGHPAAVFISPCAVLTLL